MKMMNFVKQILTWTLCFAAVLAMSGCEEKSIPVQATPHQATSSPAPLKKEVHIVERPSQYPQNYELLYTNLIEQEHTIFQIQQEVEDGLYSYEDLTRFFLDRIEEFQDYHVILTTMDDAIENAKACDRNPGAGTPLYGIPVILMDNVDTAGTRTTAGVYLLRDRIPQRDAFVVQLLKIAGAVPIAKANLDELNGYVIAASETVSGGSSMGGIPVSPYGSGCINSGASSASAICVTLNLAPLAIGMDTLGSLLGPAACNSVVGIRPSRALVSHTGIIPGCYAYDVAGPFAKTVKEAACALYAMQGSDIDDRFQTNETYHPIDDPLLFLSDGCAEHLKGKRVLLGTGSENLPEELTDALKNAGAALVSGISYDPYADDASMKELGNVPYEYGVRDSINAFLAAEAVEDITSIPLLVGYNEQNEELAIPYGQDRLIDFAMLAPMTYASVGTVDQYLRSHGINSFMRKNNLDLILTSDANITAYGDMSLNPSVSLPMGQLETEDGNKPLLSAVFTARENDDETAIIAAYVAESQLGSQRIAPGVPE